MPPLRVLHVIESLGHGGAEQNLLSLLRQLPREKFSHHLAWLRHDERLIDGFRPLVDSMIPLKAGPGLGLLAATARLRRWIRDHAPQVVHVQLVRSQIVGRIAALCAGRVPVVTTWQNVFYAKEALADFANSRLRRAVVRGIDGLTGFGDNRFIGVSAHVARELGRQLWVPSDRVSVIYNCVEPARYAQVNDEDLAALRTSLDVPTNARLLLTVGRLVEQKNQAEAVLAMKTVTATHPEAVLLIAGAGPGQGRLQDQIRTLDLSRNVRLLGARADIPALLQLADLFVFPSLYEGLSVALVEALANGLGAVVSDIPQNREIADGIDAVSFVSPGDPVRLAQIIGHRLNGALCRPTRADRDRLRTTFAPASLAAKLGDILQAAARPI